MADIHMIGTQKAWDAIDEKGCLNGLMIMGSGELKPMPEETDSQLFYLACDIARHDANRIMGDDWGDES